MRDASLVLAFAYMMAMVPLYPFAGVLCWAWVSLMNPHRLVYTFAYGQPFNAAVAALTLGCWLLSREPKRLPTDAMPWVMLSFLLWITINSFFAPDPDWSWPLWSQTMKTFVLVFLVMFSARSKSRIQALVWTIVVSLAFYGVKGGVFTLLTGGAYRVYGPDSTAISDNNALALAITMSLPLVRYLHISTENEWIRRGLGLSLAIQIMTVLGSYSRGGIIALSVMLFMFWLQSKRKVVYLAGIIAVLLPALALMPDSFYARMDTISHAGQDDSFMGRVYAWRVCLYYALDHFPLGAGFAGTQQPPIFNHYFPDIVARAAHSIYFQVLGEHGFPALVLYLLIIGVALNNCRWVIRHCRGRPSLSWAADLAGMLRISLITFAVGGAALSVAYYDGFLLLIALPSVLRALASASTSKARFARIRKLQNSHTLAFRQ